MRILLGNPFVGNRWQESAQTATAATAADDDGHYGHVNVHHQEAAEEEQASRGHIQSGRRGRL